jgi:Phosphotransferase enzyme family
MTTTVAQREFGLQACVQETFAGRSVRIVGHEQLKIDVHRLRVEVDGAERSVVAKWSDPVVARRCWLVARRWLPAAGLEDRGPPLLAVVAEPTGEGAWHVYEDLHGHALSTEPPVSGDVEAAIDAIARVHTAFADHSLLPEFRLWGGDRGIHFYSANVRDAVVALSSLDLKRIGAEGGAAREALLQRMGDLKNEETERGQVLAALGGADTLVHGDLWPTNAVVLEDEDAVRVRLIDWDEAAAGPVGFDLSTLLVRFDSSQRRWILDIYRHAVDRLAGWELPDEPELNLIFETAAYARLASLLVWSVAAAGEGESEWLRERLAEMVDWIDAVRPVLP